MIVEPVPTSSVVGVERIETPEEAIDPALPWSARPSVEGRTEYVSALGVRYGPSGVGVPGLTFGAGSLLWTNAMVLGVTERLQIAVPLYFGYRFGASDGHQFVAHAGASSVGFGFSGNENFIFELGMSVGGDAMLRFGGVHQFLIGAGVGSFGHWSSERRIAFQDWRASAGIGYVVTIGDIVTLAIGARVGSNFVEDGSAINPLRADSGLAWSLGSVNTIAGRGLPLLRAHVSEVWSVDGYLILHFAREEQLGHSYLVGTTINW